MERNKNNKELYSLDDFGGLVREYQSPLRRYFWYLTRGETSLSDDLAQETFLKAYLKLHTLNDKRKFKSWLFSIAFHVFLDSKRSQKTFLSLEDLPPSKSYHIQESNIFLSQSLQCLSVEEQSLVVLSVIDEFSHKEIAVLHNMPIGTVKTIIRRGKIKLKEHLQNEKDYF